ncbi:MAG: Zn-ribbon domain-containing OB-fold protein [Mycobacterium sp.]
MTTDSTYRRPQTRLAPSPTAESMPFWTGGREGQLLINRCHACRRFFHPPGPACWRCRSTDVAPEPVSGRGKVAAYTVNRQPWIPGLEPPYIIAMVELEDEPDVRLITNVVDVSVEDVCVGLPVEVFFEDWTDPSGDEQSRVWLPLFRPVTADADR